MEIAERLNWRTEESELFALLGQRGAITSFEIQIKSGLDLGGTAVTQEVFSGVICCVLESVFSNAGLVLIGETRV